MERIPRVLTIAGSDSGGCAGIQADLKTFGALGVHGMSALTAVTAQDTLRVHAVLELTPSIVSHQIDAVVRDIGVDAVKTGMLPSTEIILAVASKIREYEITRLVVDPVMVSAGGDALVQKDAVESLSQALLPLALIVTPNRDEAEQLSGTPLEGIAQIEKALREIHSMGPQFVLIKGGHLDSEMATDYLFDGKEITRFSEPRVRTNNLHGSGCTLASAIAAYLSHGSSVERSVKSAKDFVTQAIRRSLNLGKGRGPLGHFHSLWPSSSSG